MTTKNYYKIINQFYNKLNNCYSWHALFYINELLKLNNAATLSIFIVLKTYMLK